MQRLWRISPIILFAMPPSALAGELPRYEPSPTWVDVAPLPNASNADLPSVALLEEQRRIVDGQLWIYTDKAVRVSSPEVLAQLTTLTSVWTPDKGDLIIHELSISREGRRIDLLANGQKFTVMRREQALEQRDITGVLTATMAVGGLQVGDILRMRISQTMKDAALAGHVQGGAILLADPMKIGSARFRLSWPTDTHLHTRLFAEGANPLTSTKGGFTQIDIKLPVAKQPEMPEDSPLRFRHPALFEFSDFADWPDVSKTMAPLYRTDGAIVAGTPLAAQVDAIEKAEPSQIGRAERALELVQDRISYLSVEMNGGNYVPQAPAHTWELRYGDCKAKTLLLLALLHAMGIEAEPVLASTKLGDWVPDRLPSAAAFNHVLVHATIGGENLWLDGTLGNSRLADIHDTPRFEHVLPLRAAGAELLTIVPHPNRRPTIDYTIESDESASSDLPAAVSGTAVMRGGLAVQIAGAKGNIDDKTLRSAAAKLFGPVFGQDFEAADASITVNQADGTATVVAHGVMPSRWETEDRKRKRAVLLDAETANFSVDRDRPAWASIPVALAGPEAVHYHIRVHLPDGGKGATIEGAPTLKARVAIVDVSRSVTISHDMAEIESRLDDLGGEIPASDIAARRLEVAQAASRAPRIVADASSLRAWQINDSEHPAGTQVAALEAAYAKIFANDPTDVTGLTELATLHEQILDRKSAIADLTRAIAIAPNVDLYLKRAREYRGLGSFDLARADVDAARGLDPSSDAAIGLASWLMADKGDLPGAVALLDEKISGGGKLADEYRSAKAEIVGRYGDAQDAVRQIDGLIDKKPGSPDLLNQRCWIKGTRSIMLDTALKDCTSAIELSSDSFAALDSRAMVWFKMARFEDALRDLDAVLADHPDVAQTHFLRGVVLKRLHRDAEAAIDLRLARNIDPSLDRDDAAYGVKP